MRRRDASSSRWPCRWRQSTASPHGRSRFATGTRRRCTCGGPVGRWPRPELCSSLNSSTTLPPGRMSFPPRPHRTPNASASSSSSSGSLSGRTPPTSGCWLPRTRRSCAPPAATRRRSSTPSPAAGPSRWRLSGSGWRPTRATSTRSRCSSTRRSSRSLRGMPVAHRSSLAPPTAWRGSRATGRERPGWPRTSGGTAVGCATRRSGGSAIFTRWPLCPTGGRRRSSRGSGRGP
ncbi:MAG: hypothetical protein BWY91_01651 [bacterium ADurb.BinA028]|nr:MAG: hypothetical protein BWY91_01651 [bacterium ADurb.BinA028]